MKTCLQITILVALLAASSAFAAQVNTIGLSHENGATTARIELQGPFQFTHMTEVPKDGKPDRLIVDIIGATHTWGPKEWASLPQCNVTKLRIGQYSSKPEKVVRVVFELSKAPVYQAESDGKSIRIKFTDASVKPFAVWTTGPAPATAPVVAPTVATAPAATKPATVATPNVVAQKPATPAPTMTAPVQSKPATPTVAVTPKPESKPATAPAAHGTMAQQNPAPAPVKPTPTVAKAPAVAPATQAKPVVAPAVPASKPTVAAQPTTQPTTPAVKPAPPVQQPAPKPAVTVAQQETKPGAPALTTKPTTPAQPAAKPAVAVNPPTSTAPTAASKPATQIVTPSPTPAVVQTAPAVKPATPDTKTAGASAKPEQLAKVDQFKPVQTPTVPAPVKSAQPSMPTATPAAPVVAVATPAPAVTPPAVKPAETASKPSADAAPAAEANAPKPVAPDKPMLAEADDAPTGIATPARTTARFRRSATASSKMKSSLVAEFPQRLVVKYENSGYRDPFATLIDDTRTYDTPIEKRLANVEGIRLVGILESAGGDNRALFQDKRNFSYMLKAGDKVEKGYVLRVETDKVYFQIFEYGWSRTVALTFENRN